MTDVVSPEKRSSMMSGIQGKNTRPEMAIRQGLHALGFRYRLHDRRLPGAPDMVFPRYRAVILVNGCFWHAHGCHLFKWPTTRQEFWKAKISGNAERDGQNLVRLSLAGWRVLTIWECALKGRTRLPLAQVLDTASEWLRAGTSNAEIQGDNDAGH